ncbi:MAG TPA: serine/threonine-protein kinase [Polyangiaceae bacterium]|nr:serine/threonine-protein kinase [Polyangiaceae bacterium]
MYPQVFGKYVLERELARGGMARVVLATLRGAGGFEKKLVVKQIREELACDDDFVRRFVEEAKTTVALAHPNIVPVYELGVELGTYFLAMEFVEGASLAELLRAVQKENKPLSPAEGAYVGVEVCRALDYAHRRMNVVHRDVTPRNVMVDEEGGVKVIDFGISAPVATAPSGAGVFGSPGHMPPEQVAGKELTPAADVFAVAVLLMELWSGKAPFRRHTNEAIDEAMRAPHPKPSDADVRLLPLDDVIGAAMSLDPKKRPQEADELGRALRKFLTGMDLGDVAKLLGARVKAVRASPPPPSNEKKPALQRPPSRPQAVDMGTKTFAAREEVLPTADGGGTRRLVSEKPPKPGKEIETVATRPIESGPREAETAPAAARRSNVVWFAFAGAAAAAVAAFYLGRGVSPTTTPTPPASATAAATATSTSTATTASTPTPTLTATRTPIPTPSSTPTPTATPSPPPGPTPTASVAAEKATLMLLGDGTTVSIDGASRGPAPTKAAVDPGTHSVLFTFPATGEVKGTSLTVKSGDKVTLRADFTGATPTIRVQR